jgi:murein DD-endopeptidase MepM/ murein hydrolase activator NlpD
MPNAPTLPESVPPVSVLPTSVAASAVPRPAPLRGRVIGFAAMAAAALMMITGSVPATAASADVLADSVVAPAARNVQSLTVAQTAPIVIERDGYTVAAAPAPAPAPAPAADPAAVPAAPAAPAGPAIQWPVPASTPVSDDYGPRSAPCSGCSTFHKGADLTAGLGAPIQAIADGVVTEVSATDDGGLGVHAVVEHVVDGQTVSSVYGHMIVGSLLVSVGQTVTVGQQVGSLGSTGQSTGPHLHFEILLDGTTPTDPLAWLGAHATA